MKYMKKIKDINSCLKNIINILIEPKFTIKKIGIIIVLLLLLVWCIYRISCAYIEILKYVVSYK